MKFFIPAAENEEQEQKVYQSIKEHITSGAPGTISERKIFSLSYKHDGTNYQAEVGIAEKPNGELVIAILYDETRDLYHVCTPNRGVVKGGSIMVGAHDVSSVSDFDS